MKIEDFISKSIQEYPNLYKKIDYESSKLEVLNDIFFTTGNGLKLAETENPEYGGYVVEAKYKRNTKNRIKDKPYGKEKYKPIPKGYFESNIFYIPSYNYPLETININDNIYFRYKNNIEPLLLKAENNNPFMPCAINNNCCIACDVYYKDVFLQEDWMRELIFLCERSLEYYRDEKQYTHNVYYPSEKRISKQMKYFQERFDKEGLNGVLDLRKLWNFEIKEILPSYAEIETKKMNNWKKFQAEQIEFLINFLKKYES